MSADTRQQPRKYRKSQHPKRATPVDRHLDRKVRAVFDRVGSFFVDTYYNSHYKRAEVDARAERSTITEAYRAIIATYCDGIKRSDKHYKQVVIKAHQYADSTTGRNTNLADFDDYVLSQVIPPAFYGDFTADQKSHMMRRMITHFVENFSKVALANDTIGHIIDDHGNENNVTRLQDIAVDILASFRDAQYAEFDNVMITGSKQCCDSARRCTRLLDDLKQLKAANTALTDENARAVRIIKLMTSKAETSAAKIDELSAQVNDLAATIEAPLRGPAPHHATHHARVSDVPPARPTEYHAPPAVSNHAVSDHAVSTPASQQSDTSTTAENLPLRQSSLLDDPWS